MSKTQQGPAVYVDSSVILRLALGEDSTYPLYRAESVFSSEILWVECSRTLDRLRLQDRWDTAQMAGRVRILQAILDTLRQIPLEKKILKRASEPFSAVIKTLDAIHLASALRLQEHLGQAITFVTYDSRQGLTAMACGLQAEGYN